MQNREVLPLLGPVNLRRDDRWHPRETYLSLNKGFGNVPSEKLIDLAVELEKSQRPGDLAVAGSALIEATIFSAYRSAETLNGDIGIIEYGGELLRKAAAGYWDELERSFGHYNDQTTALRAEVRAAFTPIYTDMLHGRFSEASRRDIYTRLAYLGRYTRSGSIFRGNGLCYEIATLMGGLTDDSVVIPSTPRADSGIYNDHATHDFTHLTLDEYGSVKTNTPLELKNEGDEIRKLENARRYSQFHVVVLDANKDLGLHKDDLDLIFSHNTPDREARRKLRTIRTGIYSRVTEAGREFGAEYPGSFTN